MSEPICEYDDCDQLAYGTTPDGKQELCEECLIDTEYMRTCEDCGEFGALLDGRKINPRYVCQNCHAAWI